VPAAFADGARIPNGTSAATPIEFCSKRLRVTLLIFSSLASVSDC